MLSQHNAWCVDGHEFFVRNRLLRYLEEPRAQAALGTEGISGIERICSKFRDLVPATPPVLCHGDLWKGNCLATHDGHLAVVDPPVTYTWAEVDISMMYCEDPPPGCFFDAYHFDAYHFDAYHDVHPAERGWQERMELLHLRELLSTVAHFGDLPAVCERVHSIIRTYG